MTQAIINGKFYTASLEGMPRVGREITAALDRLLAQPDRAAIKLTLCVPEGATGFEDLTNIPVETAGRRSGFLWEQIDLPRFARRRRVLNLTSTGPVALSNAVTVVHDAQQYATPRSFHWKHRLLYRTVTPAICRRHGRIVTVSDYAKRQIASFDLCRADKIDVIYNGADHMLRGRPDETILERLGLGHGTYLLCNSYVHDHKNVRVVLEALADRPDLAGRLVLFGASTRLDYERRGIAVPDGVRFTGRITDGELRALYEHACLFLYPSKTEGFGLPPLEAMILGCPTLVSNAGAMPEVCGGGAVYADPFRPAAWLTAIEALLGDEDRRRALASAGRQRAAQFTWARAAEQYWGLLTS